MVIAGFKSATVATAAVDDATAIATVVVVVVVSVAVDVEEVVEVEEAVEALSCSRRSLDSWCRHFIRRFWNHTFTCGGKKQLILEKQLICISYNLVSMSGAIEPILRYPLFLFRS